MGVYVIRGCRLSLRRLFGYAAAAGVVGILQGWGFTEEFSDGPGGRVVV